MSIEIAYKCPDCGAIYPVSTKDSVIIGCTCSQSNHAKPLVRVFVATAEDLENVIRDYEDFRFNSNEASPELPCLFQVLVDFWEQQAKKYVARHFVSEKMGRLECPINELGVKRGRASALGENPLPTGFKNSEPKPEPKQSGGGATPSVPIKCSFCGTMKDLMKNDQTHEFINITFCKDCYYKMIEGKAKEVK